MKSAHRDGFRLIGDSRVELRNLLKIGMKNRGTL